MPRYLLVVFEFSWPRIPVMVERASLPDNRFFAKLWRIEWHPCFLVLMSMSAFINRFVTIPARKEFDRHLYGFDRVSNIVPLSQLGLEFFQ